MHQLPSSLPSQTRQARQVQSRGMEGRQGKGRVALLNALHRHSANKELTLENARKSRGMNVDQHSRADSKHGI